MRWTPLFFLLLAACTRETRGPVDPALAAYLPADATVIAGVDLDRLRATPFYARIPEAMREGSYVVAAYTGKEIVTASRVGSEIRSSGRKGMPSDLLRHATSDPLWIVARGNAELPLTGNLANLTRLLRQTEYAVLTARPGERVEIAIQGVCRSEAAAQHLEENVRAIASLTRTELEVRREGSTVHVTGSIAAETFGKLF